MNNTSNPGPIRAAGQQQSMVPQQGYPPYPPQYHGAGSYPPVHQQPSAHYPGHGYAPQPVNVVVQNTVGHGMHPQTGLVRVANRQKGVAVVLALFLGGFGVHRFYLGQIGMGVVYLARDPAGQAPGAAHRRRPAARRAPWQTWSGSNWS